MTACRSHESRLRSCRPRLKMKGSCSWLLGGDRHLVAELSQLVDRTISRPLLPTFVQMGQDRFTVGLPIPEHMVGDDENAMPDGDDRFLFASPRDQAAIVPRQAGTTRLLGSRRTVRRLGQRP